jgi:hypothetical protein
LIMAHSSNSQPLAAQVARSAASESIRSAKYRFQVLVAAQAHSSWLDFLPDDLVQRAQNSALGIRLLSDIVARRYALAAIADDSAVQQHVWVLNDSQTLRSCALQLGVAAFASLIRRTVAQKQVRAIRAACGAHLYSKGLTTAELEVEALPEREWEGCESPEHYSRLLERSGATLMLRLLPGHAQCVARRLELVFPKTLALRMAAPIRCVDAQALCRRLDELQHQIPASQGGPLQCH